MVLLRNVYIPWRDGRSGNFKQHDLDVFLLGNHQPFIILAHRLHKDKGSYKQCVQSSDHEPSRRPRICRRYRYSRSGVRNYRTEHYAHDRIGIWRSSCDPCCILCIRRYHKGGSDAVQQLAARRYGGTDTYIGITSLIDNGKSRRIHDNQAGSGTRNEQLRRNHDNDGRRYYIPDGIVCGYFAEQCQEGAGIFNYSKPWTYRNMRRYRYS